MGSSGSLRPSCVPVAPGWRVADQESRRAVACVPIRSPTAPSSVAWPRAKRRWTWPASRWRSPPTPIPALDIEAYLARIAGLAERVRPRCRRGASARDILGQINWVLFVEEELRGNEEEYYDPRNSYLNEVLDRRLGIPISLSVLYRAVAEPLGLSVAGANLPAHFMLRVDDGDRTWFVNPFRSGAVMSREACRRRLSEILQQPVDLTDEMARALPGRHGRHADAPQPEGDPPAAEDLPSLLPVQRRLAALNPIDADEVRDLGVLCLRAERPGEAVDPLRAFLAAAPTDARAPEIAALLDAARRRLAEWN